MIWILTIAYFLLNSCVVWVGFEAYAWALKKAGMQNGLGKISFAILVYASFSLFLVGSLLIGFSALDPGGTQIQDNAYVAFYLFCFSISLIPGFRHFKRTHLEALQKLGFFRHQA